MKYLFRAFLISASLLLVACNHPSVPSDAQKVTRQPHIFPDYTDVTVPPNICPLNFAVQEGATDVVAQFTFPGGTRVFGDGQKVLIDEMEWKKMLKASKGKSMKVEVYAEVDGQWPLPSMSPKNP